MSYYRQEEDFDSLVPGLGNDLVVEVLLLNEASLALAASVSGVFAVITYLYKAVDR